MKVTALLHKSPKCLSLGKSEEDPEPRKRLEVFRKKVSESKLVRFWEKASELPGIVALSLPKTIKTYPAIGWVRANIAANEDVLSEINQLRKENTDLEEKIRSLEGVRVDDLASMDDKFSFTLCSKSFKGHSTPFSMELSWNQIFCLIAADLISYPTQYEVMTALTGGLIRKTPPGFYDDCEVYLKKQDMHQIMVQLMAQNLINTSFTQKALDSVVVWSLTKKGHQHMLKICSAKTQQERLGEPDAKKR